MTASHPALERARTLHSAILEARREQRRAKHRLAGLLRQMQDDGLYWALGYVSLAEYARAELDLDVRQTRALLHLGQRLPEMPAIDAALASGHLGWTKAREILRVATRETEQAWLERARTVSRRVLEHEVARARVGEQPPVGAPDDPRGSARLRVVFEMEAADAERLYQALRLLRRQTGTDGDDVEDGALLAAMAQHVLDAVDADRGQDPDPDDAPAEPYRVVLQHCPECGHTTGLDADTSDTVALEAACDAEQIDMRPGPDRGRASRTIPPTLRRIVLCRDRWRCSVPGCRNRLWLHLHHLHAWAYGGRHSESNITTVCSAHHRMIHEGLLALERADDGCMVAETSRGRWAQEQKTG